MPGKHAFAAFLSQRFCRTKIIDRQICGGRRHVSNSKFVPSSSSVSDQGIRSLFDFMRNSSKLFVLTGAGVSTESGIPDYRSEGVGLYATSNSRPIQHSDFLKDTAKRQRYWARNFVGWPRFSSVQPNSTHHFLAALESKGFIHWLVTQNVDRLHSKAGSKQLTELHGSSHDVVCLQCNDLTDRETLQSRMHNLNPDFNALMDGIAPDGDAFVENEAVKRFKVPLCQVCEGMLKPNVVFFGDTVPRSRVGFIRERLTESDGMLVIGSSVEVFSSFRFVLAAKEQNIPVAILNIGKTRADKHASLIVQARCGEVVSRLSPLIGL